MLKQKQKWTSKEEEALYDGVIKHGHGKWTVILSDPQFASSLANRSNIDLKDKWRNMDVSGSSRSRTPRLKGVITNLPPSSPEPLSAIPLFEGDVAAESPDYKAMILQALCSIEDPNGLDASAILNFIKLHMLQQMFEVPDNFKKSVTSKLRRLVLTELEKKGNRYRYKRTSSGPKISREDGVIPNNVNNNNNNNNNGEQQNVPESSMGKETPEDAAAVAAFLVVVANNMERKAAKARHKANKLEKLLEESMVMLNLAEKIHQQCSRDGMVVLNP